MNFLKNSISLWLLLILTNNLCFGQDILKSNQVKIGFFSSTPIEDIKALSEKGASVLLIKSKDIVFQVSIKSFEFSNKLMQQHFNESYMESDKYPTASFKGKIVEDIDFSKKGNYPITAKGKLKVHGVEKDRTINGTLQISDTGMSLTSAFDVACKDHQIEIPSIVFKKIAEVIKVNLNVTYKIQ